MRVFIAFEPPEDAVSTLVEWQHTSKPEGVYLEPPTNLHLTLAFLGEVDDELIPHITEILSRLDPSTVTLSGPIEYREQDRLAFLVYQEQGGTAIWDAINQELYALYGYEPQFKPWLAHTTVWRYAPDHKPNVNPPLPNVSFTPTGVHLYTSVKNPAGGATYQKVGGNNMRVVEIDCVLTHPDGDRPFIYVYDTDTLYIATETGHHEELLERIYSEYDEDIWERKTLAGEYALLSFGQGFSFGIILRNYLYGASEVPPAVIQFLHKEFPGQEIYGYDSNAKIIKMGGDVLQFPVDPAMQHVINDVADEQRHKQEDLLTPGEAANTLRAKGSVAFGYYNGSLEFGEHPRQLASRHFNEVQPGLNRWDDDIPQFYGGLRFDHETNTLDLDHYNFVGTQQWEKTEIPGIVLNMLNGWLSSNGFPPAHWQTNQFIHLATVDPAQFDGKYNAYPNEYDPDYARDNYQTFPTGGPFGWIEGSLLAGAGHHQGIIVQLLKHGWTWEDLFVARQAWGWFSGIQSRGGHERYLTVYFSSDAGFQNNVDECVQDLANRYKLPVKIDDKPRGVKSEEAYGTGLSGKDNIQFGLRSDYAPTLIPDPIPPAPSQQMPEPDTPPGPTNFPPPKQAVERDPVRKVNPFNESSEHSFISFIYFANSDELWIGSWGNNHDELLTEELGVAWEENTDAMVELLQPTTILGTIWHENDTFYILLNRSDVLDDTSNPDLARAWHENRPINSATPKAFQAVKEWLEQNAQAAGHEIRVGAIPNVPTPRVVWSMDRSGKLWMSVAHPTTSHADLPVHPTDVRAAGDFYILENQTATGNLYQFNLTNRSKFDILSYVTAEFRRNHPYVKLEDIDDLTEKRSALKVAADRQEVGGYGVVEMESGEYPNHDAIWIDHNPRQPLIVINYNGHHDPIFNQMPELFERDADNTAAGHWRLEPSRTEPFGTGWGWHHGEPTSQEQEIIETVLRQHYKVQDLEHSWLDNKPEEDEQLKLFAKKFPPPAKFKLKATWLEEKTGGLNRPAPWQAVYDAMHDHLVFSTDMKIKMRGETKLSGFYTKIENYEGPYATRAIDLAEEALEQRWLNA